MEVSAGVIIENVKPLDQKALDDESAWNDRALVWAADGKLEVVRELIAAGANPDGMPLIMAIQCNEPEIVQTLIDAGSNINMVYKDTTPLIRAVTACYPQLVRLLLDAGADINQLDAQDQSPLVAAQGQVRLNATKQERDAVFEMLEMAGAKK